MKSVLIALLVPGDASAVEGVVRVAAGEGPGCGNVLEELVFVDSGLAVERERARTHVYGLLAKAVHGRAESIGLNHFRGVFGAYSEGEKRVAVQFRGGLLHGLLEDSGEGFGVLREDALDLFG